MALLLSAQSGSVVTPAQLLGSEEEEQAERQLEAKKEVDKLLRRMKRAERKRLANG